MQYSHHCFLCDCTIEIGEFQFKAHRNVLASFSEYFGAIYRSTSENNVFLDQSQVKADGFQKLLDITGNIEFNQQTCLLTLRDYNNREKSEVSTDSVQANPKQGALAKNVISNKKEEENKTVQYPSDILENASVELFLDLISVVENTFPAQYIVQTVTAKRKCGKSQPNCVLKEHSMSKIASVKSPYEAENTREELDQRYSKAKPMWKVFSEVSSLRRHMRIHKGVKPYVCHLCGKAFTQCNQLKTHVRTHTGEKPYQCELCDKGFAQKCQLVFHSHMHHGEEKLYKCDVCNLQFATSSNLKIHARKHSGEKPYVCDRCGQRFPQASTLNYHVCRHTGEKPYVCDTCGKAFAVSSSLITHSRKHTGEKAYICGICGKSFISSAELNKHFVHSGADKTLDASVEDDTWNTMAVKSSDMTLPLALPLGTEDHHMLLPVTDIQSPTSDTLLRSTVNRYSEPQLIFLQQLY
uniref:Myoneurin n=1 Tax=Rhinopithecus roxellana TaxID=61622 RepID=A0A2K6NN50_RHIRO